MLFFAFYLPFLSYMFVFVGLRVCLSGGGDAGRGSNQYQGLLPRVLISKTFTLDLYHQFSAVCGGGNAVFFWVPLCLFFFFPVYWVLQFYSLDEGKREEGQYSTRASAPEI